MLAPRDFRIVVRDSGRRLLRFTTIIVNIGRGPFQLSGYDDDGFAAKKDILSVKQQILEPDGTFSPHNTTATMFWAGDGHDHWHVTGLQVSKLQNLDGRGGRQHRQGRLLLRRQLPVRIAPSRRTTRPRTACARRSRTAACRWASPVNWGDIYPSTFAFQWIDITGLPERRLPAQGHRRSRRTVPGGSFLESDETNNRGLGEDPDHGRQVTVLSKSQPARRSRRRTGSLRVRWPAR